MVYEGGKWEVGMVVGDGIVAVISFAEDNDISTVYTSSVRHNNFDDTGVLPHAVQLDSGLFTLPRKCGENRTDGTTMLIC